MLGAPTCTEGRAKATSALGRWSEPGFPSETPEPGEGSSRPRVEPPAGVAGRSKPEGCGERPSCSAPFSDRAADARAPAEGSRSEGGRRSWRAPDPEARNVSSIGREVRRWFSKDSRLEWLRIRGIWSRSMWLTRLRARRIPWSWSARLTAGLGERSAPPRPGLPVSGRGTMAPAGRVLNGAVGGVAVSPTCSASPRNSGKSMSMVWEDVAARAVAEPGARSRLHHPELTRPTPAATTKPCKAAEKATAKGATRAPRADGGRAI